MLFAVEVVLKSAQFQLHENSQDAIIQSQTI